MAFDLDEEELRATRKMNKTDRDEIEVNEYVRLARNQGINKIIDKEDDRYILESEIADSYGDITCFLYECELQEEIVKHSKQLIYLVEVGDFVNGREVKHIAMFEGFPDYPKLIFVDETHLIPDDTCEKDEIKTILTKEQYLANCYKLGGEE